MYIAAHDVGMHTQSLVKSTEDHNSLPGPGYFLKDRATRVDQNWHYI